jgi:Flp pilus assembly protein TadG
LFHILSRLKVMRLLDEDSGQSTVLMAISIACVCGLLGLSVDVGLMFRTKRMLQTAADCGAIAGAAELNYGDSVTAAQAATAQNGATNGTNGVVVAVNPPPLYGPNKGAQGYVEVIVTRSVPTYFMRIFHVNAMTVAARAVAGLGPSQGCIYTLDTSGSDISLTGSGNLSVPNCGLIVDSTSSNAVSLTGSGTIVAKSIGIVGGSSVTGSGHLNPAPNPPPVTGIAPVSNPLSFLQVPSYDASSCLAALHLSGASPLTIGPPVAGGTVCYNGISNSGSGALTLNPGVYVITGSFSGSGSGAITGTGVTIYLAGPNGSLSLTGSGALNLTAPTSGPYSGVLFFEDPSDTKPMNVTGSAGTTLTGIFYAPSAALSLTGSSGAIFNAAVVTYTLSITGSGSLNEYMGSNGTSPLSTARVVE